MDERGPDTATDRLSQSEWTRVRRDTFNRDNHSCRNCESDSNLTVHHIVPISAGGTNEISNLATLCRSCHKRAHNRRSRDNSPNHNAADNRAHAFTLSHVRSIVNSTWHPLDRVIVILLAKTGIGVGELCNLESCDLEVKKGDIGGELPTESRSWNPTDDPFLRIRYGDGLPHNNRRERVDDTYIPLDSEANSAVIRWLMVRPDGVESDPLFLSTREDWGQRLDPDNVRYILKKIGEPLGFYEPGSELENLTPLSLRVFFRERYAGQPASREYVLGARSNPNTSIKDFATHYRNNIFTLTTRRYDSTE